MQTSSRQDEFDGFPGRRDRPNQCTPHLRSHPVFQQTEFSRRNPRCKTAHLIQSFNKRSSQPRAMCHEPHRTAILHTNTQPWSLIQRRPHSMYNSSSSNYSQFRADVWRPSEILIVIKLFQTRRKWNNQNTNQKSQRTSHNASSKIKVK